MIKAFQHNWKLYGIEAWAVGMFMLSATLCTILMEHPAFHVADFIPHASWRRLCIGLAMGVTATLLIYSKWGKQSGAHMNPAVTLAHLFLHRIHTYDAVWYIVAQVVGSTLFIALLCILIPSYVSSPSVNFIITIPGKAGVWIAFAAEAALSFFLFIGILLIGNSRIARFTGYIVGVLICLFIWLEAPLSGMSLNPARSFGSAINAGVWTSFWIYILALFLACYSPRIYTEKYITTKREKATH